MVEGSDRTRHIADEAAHSAFHRRPPLPAVAGLEDAGWEYTERDREGRSGNCAQILFGPRYIDTSGSAGSITPMWVRASGGLEN